MQRLDVSGVVRLTYRSLCVKGLNMVLAVDDVYRKYFLKYVFCVCK